MTIPPEHRIGRVEFQISAPDSAAAQQISAFLRARFDSVISPALDRALERIVRPGEVLRIGRVEIDLGRLDQGALTGQGLRRQIEAALAAALAEVPAPATPDGQDAFAELGEFLDSGELPWFEPGKALAALAATLAGFDANAMTRLAIRIRTRLIRRRAAERLVRQFPAVLVRRIFRALLPESVAAGLAVAFGPDGPAPSGQTKFVPEAQIPDVVEMIHRLARSGSSVDTGKSGPDLGAVISAYAALDPTALPATTPASMVATDHVRADIDPEIPEIPIPPDHSVAEDDHAEASPRPVHAAGAVILHPFLSHFYDQLDLLAEPGRFRSNQARARAVLLTHHIATGATDAPEPETPLFKLLCGMDLSDPIPRRLELTDAERGETAALLKSIIAHWKRLGTTSPAGLREGFLTRPGLLDRERTGWRLRVERRGIDVLLDGLPWALSSVKTPFMPAPLTVDWG